MGLEFYKKKYPYVVNAKNITAKQMQCITDGNIPGMFKLYNRTFLQNLVYCDCPDTIKQIEEELIITIYYQNNNKI